MERRPDSCRPSRRGQTIPDLDLVAAATALHYNQTVLTSDKHFKRVPGLKLYEVAGKDSGRALGGFSEQFPESIEREGRFRQGGSKVSDDPQPGSNVVQDARARSRASNFSESLRRSRPNS